jgi:membrane associated rhomboid family serine protease
MFPIGDSIPRRNPPITTWLLIILNSLVFVFEIGMSPERLHRLFYLFGLVPARITHPSWPLWVGFPINAYWPLLTCMFVHGNWLHIIGNMWALWIFGDNVEDRMGPVRFLFFYLLCGLAAGMVHVFTNPDSTLPTVGASGAIAGVMGAYFVLFPYARVIVVIPLLFIPLFFEMPAVLFLGMWALTQFFSGTLAIAAGSYVRGIAWWAHVGGFFSGVLLQFLFVPRKGAYRRPFRDEYQTAGAWVPARYWRSSS